MSNQDVVTDRPILAFLIMANLTDNFVCLGEAIQPFNPVLASEEIDGSISCTFHKQELLLRVSSCTKLKLLHDSIFQNIDVMNFSVTA